MKQRIEQLLGEPVSDINQLSSSWGLKLSRASLASGRQLAIKSGKAEFPDQLECEGNMLNDLSRAGLPVPAVLFSGPDILVMDWINASTSRLTCQHQHHAGELVAGLHTRPAGFFGYGYDTVIGALPQPNPKTGTWLDFFRDHRLLYMAELAHKRGRLPISYLLRIEKLAERLDRYISEPPAAALLHGDIWGGNVLAGENGRIAAFIDPAIYYGHPEIELAFTQMFATFSTPFFESYAANAPFEKDFFELRCDLYNLYPTLVHVCLFGSSYLPPINTTLARLSL